MGFPELGSVSISEIQSVRHPVFNTEIYNNLNFKADYPMSAYADAARAHGAIVWDKYIIARYAMRK